MGDISVPQSDGLWKEAVQRSSCFGAQCSVVPTRGKKLEQVVPGV